MIVNLDFVASIDEFFGRCSDDQTREAVRSFLKAALDAGVDFPLIPKRWDHDKAVYKIEHDDRIITVAFGWLAPSSAVKTNGKDSHLSPERAVKWVMTGE